MSNWKVLKSFKNSLKYVKCTLHSNHQMYVIDNLNLIFISFYPSRRGTERRNKCHGFWLLIITVSRSSGVSEHLHQCLLIELDLIVKHEANLPFTPALSCHIPAPVSAVHRNQMAVSCSFLSVYIY